MFLEERTLLIVALPFKRKKSHELRKRNVIAQDSCERTNKQLLTAVVVDVFLLALNGILWPEQWRLSRACQIPEWIDTRAWCSPPNIEQYEHERDCQSCEYHRESERVKERVETVRRDSPVEQRHSLEVYRKESSVSDGISDELGTAKRHDSIGRNASFLLTMNGLFFCRWQMFDHFLVVILQRFIGWKKDLADCVVQLIGSIK